MKIKTFTLICISSILAINACKKDESSTSNSSSSPIIGTWKLSSFFITGPSSTIGKDTTIDAIALGYFKPCELDDLIRFNSDNTTTSFQGNIKCDSTAPDSKNNGTWSLVENNSKIRLDTNTFADILILSNTTFQMRLYPDTSSGMKYKYIDETYTRQ